MREKSRTKGNTGSEGEERESREALIEALRRPRYEVIPLQGVEQQVVKHVPRDVKLTVTASPQKGIGTTLDLAERLVVDEAHLEDILQRFHGSDIQEVFVVAGDVEEPAGKFAGADELLPAMAELGHDFDEIGITGYRESHPLISDATTIEAMYDKESYATYIVSQICFDPEVISGWIRRVRRRGVGLPIYIGMPGAVNRQKLVRISRNIGFGESARFLKKQHNWLLRLLLPGGYSPDRLIEGLIPSLADPQNKVWVSTSTPSTRWKRLRRGGARSSDGGRRLLRPLRRHRRRRGRDGQRHSLPPRSSRETRAGFGEVWRPALYGLLLWPHAHHQVGLPRAPLLCAAPAPRLRAVARDTEHRGGAAPVHHRLDRRRPRG